MDSKMARASWRRSTASSSSPRSWWTSGEVEGAHGHRFGSLAGHQGAAGRGQERGGAGEVAEIVGDHAAGQLRPGQPVRTVLELAAFDLDVEQGGRLGVAALGPQLACGVARRSGANAPMRGAVGSAPLATGPRLPADPGRFSPARRGLLTRCHHGAYVARGRYGVRHTWSAGPSFAAHDLRGDSTVSNRRAQSRLPFLLALLIVLALIAASCGGNDDGGNDEGGGTTKPTTGGEDGGGPAGGFNQPEAEGEPQIGGKIVFGVESNIASLDPAGSLAQPSDVLTALAIYDP